MVAVANHFIAVQGQARALIRASAPLLIQHHQTAGIFVRERPQQQRISYSKNRCIAANTKRQRDDRRQREPWVFRQHAKSKLHILIDCGHQITCGHEVSNSVEQQVWPAIHYFASINPFPMNKQKRKRLSEVINATEYLFVENLALKLVLEHKGVGNWQKLVDRLLADKEILAGVRLKFRDLYKEIETSTDPSGALEKWLREIPRLRSHTDLRQLH